MHSGIQRRISLWLALALWLLPVSGLAAERFVYGRSEQGRDLICVRLGEAEAPASLLMTFATHGFEGAGDRDGQYLVRIAEALIEHFEQHPEALCGSALYIVPCVNPDGLLEGTSQDGFGRMNALGLDINRDFSVGWKRMRNQRYRTGEEPFATAEARSIRDLTQAIRPTWAVDVHGWLRRVYGSRELARAFERAFGFRYRTYGAGGMLSQWMESQTEAAVLVELPSRPGSEGYVERVSGQLAQALESWFAENLREESAPR